jgi:TetR/AcrR family transcriptional regulator, fatty acid metabolism regulator protein
MTNRKAEAAKAQLRPASRLPATERSAEILSSARVVIAERGYEATSMLAIAQHAGVAEGTLYRFFKTKEELMLRVAEEWLAELLAEDIGLDSIRGTWNRLRHLIWRVLQLMRSQPVVSRFVLIEMRPLPGYRGTTLFKLTRRFTADVRAVCAEAAQSGEFRDDVSPSLLRDMIFGCIEHQTWSFLRREGDFEIDAVADSITNVVYRGMLANDVTREDRMERVLARLERAAAALERGGERQAPTDRP